MSNKYQVFMVWVSWLYKCIRKVPNGVCLEKTSIYFAVELTLGKFLTLCMCTCTFAQTNDIRKSWVVGMCNAILRRGVNVWSSKTEKIKNFKSKRGSWVPAFSPTSPVSSHQSQHKKIMNKKSTYRSKVQNFWSLPWFKSKG